MKNCPKCNAVVSDTAKFCIKCGFNIKKHEEENSKHFCPECGTEFSGGNFCPECGYDISNEINPTIDTKPKKKDIDLDDFGLDIETPKKKTAKPKKDGKKKDISFDDFGLDIDDMGSILDNQIKENKTSEQLIMFEYEKHKTGGYIIKKFTDTIETNIVVPDGVVAINDGAFENSLVISVKLPEGLKLIGKKAFANCKYLSIINIPSSVNRIDSEAFINCVNLNIEIPKTVSIKGADLLKNTLTEAIAIKKAEDEKRAREKALEEKRLKELAFAKEKAKESVKNEALKKGVTTKLPLEKIDAVNDINLICYAQIEITEFINKEALLVKKAKDLLASKEDAVNKCQTFASSKGISYDSKYTTLIKNAKDSEDLKKIVKDIEKEINEQYKKALDKKTKEELAKAKETTIAEIKKYCQTQGTYFWSRYETSIKNCKTVDSVNQQKVSIKKEVDNEKEANRLAKIEADKKALEQKKIDKRVVEIKAAFDKCRSEPIIEKDIIHFGLWPQAVKASNVKIIKDDGDLAYGDNGETYRRRFFYNSKTKQKDILKYFEFQYIRWIILKETKDSYFLLSDYVISGVTFNDTIADTNNLPANNYKQSSVRDFLTYFVNEAFSTQGKAKIQDTLVDNSKKSTALINGYFSEDTVDKAFLLSYQEVMKYFKKNNSVRRYTTEYAREFLGSYKHYDWWLRSPGIYKYGSDGKTGAMYVSSTDGSINVAEVKKVYGLVPAIILKKK